MSLVASLVDGQFQTATASSTSLSGSSSTDNSSGIDSDAFLTLLVAEMQNQDPLEPSSNTEWISQYATFTEVSEIQDIGTNMQNVQAENLVGEYVIMKVTSESGNTDYISGRVDYVAYESDDAYLSINGELYSINDLDTVASTDYMEAYNLASDIASTINKLPSLNDITLGNKSTIEELYETSQNMTDYQKTFLDSSVFDTIDSYYNKLQTLISGSSSSGTSTGSNTSSSDSDSSSTTASDSASSTTTDSSSVSTGTAATESAGTATTDSADSSADNAATDTETTEAEASETDNLTKKE